MKFKLYPVFFQISKRGVSLFMCMRNKCLYPHSQKKSKEACTYVSKLKLYDVIQIERYRDNDDDYYYFYKRE